MPVYFMEYVSKVPAIVEKFGGKYIVRCGKEDNGYRRLESYAFDNY
ncbi:MAG: hypothetical protein PHI20_05260 [Endomicrobiaceae bacterium]|jgi:uncharacterized protein (DUF1330 family)|nr:hypothetical protein [Endomicrobiaceae bacterium]MDD3730424.1 hypothetical protein [Endomicrobiaceae bacterium]MDD4166329.1 hypothetical protein [Endomicrobiaceae bacterium]